MCLEAVGIGVLFPLLAHVQDAHHLPTYTLGLMSGASFFAALVAQLGAGPLLDGNRARPVLLFGVLLGAGGLVWFAFAGGLGGLVGARGLGGVGYGIVSPAALRQASLGVSGERRGKRLGILSSAQMAGFTVGPLFGSVLYAAGGLRVPFEVVGGLLAVAGAGLALLPAPQATRRPRPARVAPAHSSAKHPPGWGAPSAPPARAGAPPRGRPLNDGPRVLGERWRELSGIEVAPLVAMLLLAAALQLPNGLYDSLWSRMLTDRGASALLVGLSFSFFGLPFVVLAPLGGRVAERRGPLLAAGLGLLAADCFMAAYGFVPWPILIVGLGVGEACVQSVAIPGGFASVGRVFSDDRIAAGQGLFGGIGTLAAGTAAVAGAPVFAALGGPGAFGGGAAVSAALVVAALVVGRQSRLAAPGTGAAAGAGAGDTPAPSAARRGGQEATEEAVQTDLPGPGA